MILRYYKNFMRIRLYSKIAFGGGTTSSVRQTLDLGLGMLWPRLPRSPADLAARIVCVFG